MLENIWCSSLIRIGFNNSMCGLLFMQLILAIDKFVNYSAGVSNAICMFKRSLERVKTVISYRIQAMLFVAYVLELQLCS